MGMGKYQGFQSHVSYHTKDFKCLINIPMNDILIIGKSYNNTARISEDGTGSHRPLLGDAGVSPRLILVY